MDPVTLSVFILGLGIGGLAVLMRQVLRARLKSEMDEQGKKEQPTFRSSTSLKPPRRFSDGTSVRHSLPVVSMPWLPLEIVVPKLCNVHNFPPKRYGM